jgi:hypothetical protein
MLRSMLRCVSIAKKDALCQNRTSDLIIAQEY